MQLAYITQRVSEAAATQARRQPRIAGGGGLTRPNHTPQGGQVSSPVASLGRSRNRPP